MKVGYALPIGESGGTTPRWTEIRALAKQAEAAGLDSLWVYDHLLFRRGEEPTAGIWESWTLLTAVAEATERVELGTLVLCVPFRNPAVLAKMADTLEEVSGGRLILGLGAGWHQPEFDAFGVPFDHRASRFEEALAIVRGLLRDGRVDVRGTYYSAPDSELKPRGPRPGGPPILIGTGGERMLRLTARHADAWNTCWYGDVAGIAEPRAKLEAACAEVGRDPATLEVTVGVTVRFPDLLGTPHEPVDPAKALTGSPDQIAAGLRSYAEAGVGHVICACFPGTSEALGRLTDAVAMYRSLG